MLGLLKSGFWKKTSIMMRTAMTTGANFKCSQSNTCLVRLFRCYQRGEENRVLKTSYLDGKSLS